MTRRELIPPHNGFHRPAQGEYRFTASNLPVSRITPPALRSLFTYTNGRVVAIEYSNRREFDWHKGKLARQLAELHAVSGKMAGCSCNHCKVRP